jgi:hypothetical protein
VRTCVRRAELGKPAARATRPRPIPHTRTHLSVNGPVSASEAQTHAAQPAHARRAPRVVGRGDGGEAEGASGSTYPIMTTAVEPNMLTAIGNPPSFIPRSVGRFFVLQQNVPIPTKLRLLHSEVERAASP